MRQNSFRWPVREALGDRARVRVAGAGPVMVLAADRRGGWHYQGIGLMIS